MLFVPGQKGCCVLRPSAATALAPEVTQCKVRFPKNSPREQHLQGEIDKMREKAKKFFFFLHSHKKSLEYKKRCECLVLVKGEYSSKLFLLP